MMRVSSPNYLSRNQYFYCFRKRIPKELQPIIAKKELRYSLKTGNLSEAKNKARYIAGHVQQLFNIIKDGCLDDMSLTKNQIQSMVRKFMLEMIENYNKPAAYKAYVDEFSLEDEWDPDWRSRDDHHKHTSPVFLV